MTTTWTSVTTNQANVSQADKPLSPWVRAAAKIRTKGMVASVFCFPCTVNKTTCIVSRDSKRCASCVEAGIPRIYCGWDRADFHHVKDSMTNAPPTSMASSGLPPSALLPSATLTSQEAMKISFIAEKPEIFAPNLNSANLPLPSTPCPSLYAPYPATFLEGTPSDLELSRDRTKLEAENCRLSARVDRIEAESDRLAPRIDRNEAEKYRLTPYIKQIEVENIRLPPRIERFESEIRELVNRVHRLEAESRRSLYRIDLHRFRHKKRQQETWARRWDLLQRFLKSGDCSKIGVIEPTH